MSYLGSTKYNEIVQWNDICISYYIFVKATILMMSNDMSRALNIQNQLCNFNLN